MLTARSTASGRRRPAADPPDEDGTGLVATVVGFTVVMVTLLFSVQVVIRLYATSVLSSAAVRAAETAAQSSSPAAAEVSAEAEARAQLGTFAADHVHFSWLEADGNQVVLRVRADSPEFLPVVPGWSRIDRTVTVRTERFR